MKKYMIVEQNETIDYAIGNHNGFYKSRAKALKDVRTNNVNSAGSKYYVIEVPKLLGKNKKCAHCGK